MKLLHLKLSNWGPFIGEHQIDFNFEGNRQIAVVMGKNGFGKTRILDAMKWLYAGGKEFVDPSIYVNRKAVLNGERFIVEVETKFEDQKKSFFLRRSFEVDPENLNFDEIGQITSRKSPGTPLFAEIVELQPEGKIPLDVEGTNAVLRRFFPASLVSFNFFNASNPESQAKWLEVSGDSAQARLKKESIETALGFSCSDLLTRRLSDLETTLSGEVANGATAGSKRTKLLEDKSKSAKLLEDAETSIANNRELLAVLQSERDDLNEELKGAQARIELEQELIENRGRINAKKEELQLLVDSVKVLVSDLWFYPIFDSLNHDLGLVRLNKESKVGYLMRHTELNLIIDRLESQMNEKDCATCGSQISKTVSDELKAQLTTAQDELSELEQPRLEFNDKYVSLIESLLNQDARSNLDALQEKFNRIATLRNQMVQLELEQHALLSATGGGSLEFVSKFERLNHLESNVIPPIEQSLEADRLDHERLKRDLKKANDGIAKLPGVDPKLAGKLTSLTQISELVERVIAEVKQDVRTMIESSSNVILSELLTKVDGVQTMSITEDYSIKTSKGTYTTLNDAFKQIVSLSLMFALPRVAKSSFPMFVDTPFGHLDKDHLDKFVNFMKKELKQIVILPNDANIGIDEVPAKFGEFLSDYKVLLRDPKLVDENGLEITSVDSRDIVSFLVKYKKPHDFKEGWGYE